MFRRRPSKQYCSAVGAGFSATAKVLLVMAPEYLLQIYDRGLPTVSHVTRLTFSL